MGRRVRTLREMRREYEAAEARGLVSKENEPKPEGRERAGTSGPPRLKLVWQVCDVEGRVLATFPYKEKDAAEQHAESLKARGKGKCFVRSEKVRMDD